MLDIFNFLPSLGRKILINVAFKQLLPLVATKVNQSLAELSGGREQVDVLHK